MGITNILKSFFSKTSLPNVLQQDGSVLGVDIGSASIKVVQLKKDSGKIILETYGTIALGPYANMETGKSVKLQPNQLSEALTDLMREANVTALTTAVAIPYASSLTSVIQMPKVSKDQLNSMIPIEARKYIPVSTSEVTMDWFVIPEDEAQERGDLIRGIKNTPKEDAIKETINVLLVAIHNSTLSDYQTITTTAKLDTTFYELEVFSAARGSSGHSLKPIMIVDMGASSTKIYIMDKGVVMMSHMVHKGSQDITSYIQRTFNISFDKAEKLKRESGLLDDINITLKDGSKVVPKDAMLSTLDNIFAEINRVLLSYGKKYNKSISKIILCGGGVTMPGLYDYASSKLDNAVELANPFGKTQVPDFLDDTLKEVGPEFAVSTGVALRYLYE